MVSRTPIIKVNNFKMKVNLITIAILTLVFVSCKTSSIVTNITSKDKEENMLVSQSFTVNNDVMNNLLTMFKDSLNKHIGCSNFKYYKVDIQSRQDTLNIVLQTSPNLLTSVTLLTSPDERCQYLLFSNLLDDIILTNLESFNTDFFGTSELVLDSISYKPELNWICKTRCHFFYPELTVKICKSEIIDIQFNLCK